MLSYLHQFHAGNHADVLKHCTLAIALKQMQKKAKPLTVIDTHAGRGHYDLTSAQAKKTREFKSGIGKFWGTENLNKLPKGYVSAVINAQRDANQNHITDYPGSPDIIHHLLRSDDHLITFELHSSEGERLKTRFKNNKQVSVHQRDAFEGLLALIPPKTRRGLVLIDPSYEIKSDYKLTADTVGQSIERWPEGVFIIWYPILATQIDESRAFKNAIKRQHPNGLLNIQLMVKQPSPGKTTGMIGSGVLVINQPWGLVQQMAELIKLLHLKMADADVPAHESKVEQIMQPA